MTVDRGGQHPVMFFHPRTVELRARRAKAQADRDAAQAPLGPMTEVDLDRVEAANFGFARPATASARGEVEEMFRVALVQIDRDRTAFLVDEAEALTDAITARESEVYGEVRKLAERLAVLADEALELSKARVDVYKATHPGVRVVVVSITPETLLAAAKVGGVLNPCIEVR